MKTFEIAEALGKKSNNVSTLLKKMVADGKIKNPNYGVFTLEYQHSLVPIECW